jgi:hypothetical protein
MKWTRFNSAFSSPRFSRRGFAAIWILVVLAVLMIVIELLAVQTANGIRRADHHHHQIRALWLARSGVELAAARLLANPPDYKGETLEVISRSQVHIEVHKASDNPDIFQITCEARFPTDERGSVLRSHSFRFRRITDKDQVRLEVVPPAMSKR